MKTRHQYLIFLYWIALLIDCFLIFSGKDDLRFYTKGALMPLLLLYFLGNASKNHHLPSRILAAIALILAWAGDIFLLREGQQNFIIGLVLFLSMHIVYSIYFLRVHRLFPVRHPYNVWLPLLLVGIYDVVLMFKLLPQSGDLRTPLISYMVVLSLMFVFACNVRGSKKAGSLAPQFFIPGAALFIISDSVLGLNMFIWQDHVIGIAIMLTYGYAQHLIVHGFIKHVKGRV
jgi:uncharacterized membrane protein YhhN